MLDIVGVYQIIRPYLVFFIYFVALISGMFVWWKTGTDENLDEQDLFDNAFMSIFWFFVFSRLGYVLSNFQDVGGAAGYFNLINRPGNNYLFGFVGMTASQILNSRFNEWKVWKSLDIMAMSIAVTASIFYIGLLMVGANPGLPFKYGLLYPNEVRVIPVDLLGALWFLGVYVIIRRVRKNFRFYAWYKHTSSTARDGLVFLLFCVMTGVFYVFRGFLDFLKYEVFGINLKTVFGLALIVIGSVLIYVRSGRTIKDDLQFMFTPKDAKFKDPKLRKKASLLKLRRKNKYED